MGRVWKGEGGVGVGWKGETNREVVCRGVPGVLM